MEWGMGGEELNISNLPLSPCPLTPYQVKPQD